MQFRIGAIPDDFEPDDSCVPATAFAAAVLLSLGLLPPMFSVIAAWFSIWNALFA